jgi:ATP-GRASP peptide maturase of grasp-with-spasm system
MILIFSDKTDYSTQFVCDWLDHFHANYVIIYPEHKIDLDSLLIQNGKIEFNLEISNLINQERKIIAFSKITSVWFRRGFLNLNKVSFKEITSKNSDYGNELLNFHLKEYKTITEFVYETLVRYKKILGNPFKFDINKLTMLMIAQEFGLSIPQTLITTKKARLIDFLNKSNDGIITKGIQNGFNFEQNDDFHFTYTEQVKVEDMEKIDEMFFYSLFQYRIIKKFEIRTFFINNTFFSMVVHSQDNPKTETDFRKYDDINPNKVEPFTLPKKVESKLRKVFNYFNLNTGSIDIIVDQKDKYIFLEINPVGQFGMVSSPCNYMLEKIIASYLIEK